MGFRPKHPIVEHIQVAGRMVGFTEREKNVLTLISEGKTTNEIGALLKMSGKTVFYHRGHIEEKCGTRSIAMLTRIALKAGLTALCLLFVARIAAAQTTLLFSWDNTGGPYSNIVWNLYGTANVAAPTNQWPLVSSTTTPTNVSPTRYGMYVSWTNPPGQYFFTMQWSNTFWKTNSFFSAAAVTPALPPITQPFNLGVQAP